MQQGKIAGLPVNLLQSCSLFGIQVQWLGGDDFLVGVGIAFGNLQGNFHEALVLQLAHGLGSGAGELRSSCMAVTGFPRSPDTLPAAVWSAPPRLRRRAVSEHAGVPASLPVPCEQHRATHSSARSPAHSNNIPVIHQANSNTRGVPMIGADDLGDRLERFMLGLLRHPRHAPAPAAGRGTFTRVPTSTRPSSSGGMRQSNSLRRAISSVTHATTPHPRVPAHTVKG